jgi:flagellar basal body-associated protein FliL
VADAPGKKAELDKDGLSYEIGKAELDKEGMKLSEEKKPEAPAPSAAHETPQEAEASEKPSRKKLIIIASAVAGVVVLLTAGILTYVFTREKPVEKPAVAVVKPTPPPPPALDSPTGEITLDPFMVLFTPASPKESGVLLAQISLQVSPEIAYSLGARMYEIRGLIYQRLSASAEVYSKNELLAMLRDDLKGFDIRDVGFIQFEKK